MEQTRRGFIGTGIAAAAAAAMPVGVFAKDAEGGGGVGLGVPLEEEGRMENEQGINADRKSVV